MIASLQCDLAIASAYKGPTQIARVVTEGWCANNLYCVACDSDRLQPTTANTKAVDFQCANCAETYQLKSQKKLNLNKVTDGAYSAMLAALKQNAAPNLLMLNYTEQWMVSNLLLFPSVVFTEQVLEKRKPLSETARRAGWIGCNILLARIPIDSRIALIANREIIPANVIRKRYCSFRALKNVPWEIRGWTLDILNVIRMMGTAEFKLEQMYAFEEALSRQHPLNRNIRPKIRQQLQVLRDLGFIDFLGHGQYRAKSLV